MIIYKCDICGKELDKNNVLNGRIDMYRQYHGDDNISMDLCSECYKKVNFDIHKTITLAKKGVWLT